MKIRVVDLLALVSQEAHVGLTRLKEVVKIISLELGGKDTHLSPQRVSCCEWCATNTSWNSHYGTNREPEKRFDTTAKERSAEDECCCPTLPLDVF
jgi:hypothetical protein